MITEELIYEFLEDKLKVPDIFIVEVKISGGGKITVYLDSNKGITIEECVEISRMIEKKFEEEIGDHDLEVSSPGLNMPFRILKQYLKNLGKQVTVLKKDGIKIQGKILSADEEGVLIEQIITCRQNGKKIKNIEEIKILFNEIKETRLVISIN
ncbi:MAG: hypothetical protein Q8880_08950 [Bacteroidota bacterium]|nr:hypothetical protein [Bacteroidota bacterium]